MKKGKVIGKKQLILAVMVLALGAAMWFNMRYSGGNTKYLGEAQFVDNSSSDAVETSAPINDYFASAKQERDATQNEALETITEAIKAAGGDQSKLQSAADASAKLSEKQLKQSNIENLLKAKGFADALAIIGDNDINIIVRAEALDNAATLQIQDIAATQTGFSLDKIKILTVK